MNNNMLAQAMLITYAEMGIQIIRFDNTDAGIVLLFTVPNKSYHKDANNIEMSGKHLACFVVDLPLSFYMSHCFFCQCSYYNKY